MAPREYTTIEVAGREVRVSSPGKVYFPKPGFTKLDLIEYYVRCADAVLVGVRDRPTTLKRWRDGVKRDRPRLINSTLDNEAAKSIRWKSDQFMWGKLQGLWEGQIPK